MIRKALVLALLSYGSSALAQPDPAAPPTPTPVEPPAPPTPPTEPPATPTYMPPSDEPPPPPPPTAPTSTPTMVKGKTELTFYGFIELLGMYDTTQNLNEQMQNSGIARPGTYAGNHGATQLSARHSRLGLKIAQPVTNSIKATGQFEMDFLGNQPGNPSSATAAAGASEGQFYQNAPFRFRHVFAKLETPYLDIVAGQWWSLFGWQSSFHPNSVEIQGLPGQVYKRTAQLRLAKTIKTGAVDIDLAIGAQRPPQRDSATPDGVAAIKFTSTSFKGWHTKGANDSGLDGASLGASVIGRRFAVDELSAAPSKQVVVHGYGLSLDAMIPIIPATKASHDNALTLTGSFVTGAGIADQYDGLNFGVANPSLPNPSMAATPPTYFPNIDAGLAQYASDGTLHAVQVTTYMAGLQYYLPGGMAWVALNYAHLKSGNAANFGAKAWTEGQFLDANLFVDITPTWRVGLEVMQNKQTFAVAAANGTTDATNNRVEGMVMLLF